MTESAWVLHPPELDDEEAFQQAVLAAHREIYRHQFADDLMVNHQLGMQIRAYRRVEEWRVMLILTPWMLARLLFPVSAPALEIPPGWNKRQRANAGYLLLGPARGLELLGQRQQAHINYLDELGHYLVQPIALNMLNYESPEAVFSAWNEVIQTRDECMGRFAKDCPWQKELSRREFFRRFNR